VLFRSVRLTFEDLRAAGLPLGSGVVMVFDETRDLREVLARLGHFFAHESCGKCYPCQMGTQRQIEILQRISSGKIMDGDRDRLQDVGWTMTDASLCGLGQTAASAVLSAIKLWPNLFVDNHKSNIKAPGETNKVISEVKSKISKKSDAKAKKTVKTKPGRKSAKN
jgi:NADH:ubiquinone oxidoreductase subunit F (NADH-binding)